MIYFVSGENICLHCGMCAERCPTGAWDMQKFLLLTAQHAADASINLRQKIQYFRSAFHDAIQVLC